MLHIVQRRNVRGGHGSKVVFETAVIDQGTLRPEIQVPGLLRIGQKADDALYADFLRIEEEDNFFVLHGKDGALLVQTIDQPVASHTEIAYIGFADTRIIQHSEIHLCVYDRDALGSGNIDLTLLVFRNGPNGSGLQTVRLAPHAKLAPIHDCGAAVICADPEAIPAVHEQTHHAGDARGGINTLKGIAVVTDQSAVAANPDKAFFGLRNRVGLRGGQTVRVVVQHRRVALVVPDGVDGDMDVLPVFAEGGRHGLKKGKKRQRQTEQEPARFLTMKK